MLLPISYLLFFFSFLTSHVAANDRVFHTGSNTLEITEYSVVKQGLSNFSYIRSDIFNVGSYQWATEFYPHGWDSSCSGFVSVAVRLMGSSNVVKAISTHRLRNWTTSTWSTKTPWWSTLDTYQPSSGNTAWGNCKFISKTELEASSYLSNDTLLIKTTLWVQESSSTVHLLPQQSMVSEVLPVANFATPHVSLDENTEHLAST